MYFTVDLSPYGADGDYGATTEQGVRDFQYFNSMTVDGVAGPDTFYKIDELYETILIQEGDEGAHVRRIQEQLNEQEEVNLSISVDGGYGPETVDAVEQFQEAAELNVDGIVGPYTMVALDLEAIQPLTYEELKEAVETFGSVTDILSDSKVNELIDILETNDAYNESIKIKLNSEETAGTSISYDNSINEMFLISGISEESELFGIYAIFNQEENELLGFGSIEFEGLLYSDNVRMNLYDVNGEALDSKEDTHVELENAHLILAQEVSEAFREIQAVRNMSNTPEINREICELIWYSNGVLLSRFAVLFFNLGGIKGALLRMGVQQLVEWYGDYVCDIYEP